MKLTSILLLGLAMFSISAPAFAQIVTTVHVETNREAAERRRVEEFRRQQELRRRADERRREELRLAEERREEHRRQLRLIMEQQQQSIMAEQLAIDAAQANYTAEHNAANAIRTDMEIEHGNRRGFEMKSANYAGKAQAMLDGCPAAVDQEECYALAATEKSLADKYAGLTQSSRDRIVQLMADLKTHEDIAARYAIERDQHSTRKYEIETELRGPKYIEIRPGFENRDHRETPVEVRVRAN